MLCVCNIALSSKIGALFLSFCSQCVRNSKSATRPAKPNRHSTLGFIFALHIFACSCVRGFSDFQNTTTHFPRTLYCRVCEKTLTPLSGLIRFCALFSRCVLLRAMLHYRSCRTILDSWSLNPDKLPYLHEASHEDQAVARYHGRFEMHQESLRKCSWCADRCACGISYCIQTLYFQDFAPISKARDYLTGYLGWPSCTSFRPMQV